MFTNVNTLKLIHGTVSNHVFPCRTFIEIPDLYKLVGLRICVFRGVKESYNRFICTINKSFLTEKHKRAKAGKKAFDSVIDEVALFHFKGL